MNTVIRCVLAVINERLAVRPWQSYSAIWSCVRSTSSISQESNNSKKNALKKPKTPQGRFDEAEQSNTEKGPLETGAGVLYKQLTRQRGGLQFKDLIDEVFPVGVGAMISRVLSRKPIRKQVTGFPDDINPITKEKGGPRGPEPTRYGDWERKGRCIDF